MRSTRRLQAVIGITLAVVVLVASGRALSQPYPARPVKIVQGFAAGGNGDTIARFVAQALGEMLGQPFVVEAKTGAGGNIASEAVARSAGDGYTLILQTGGHAVSAAIYRSLPFDPVADFKWLSLVSVFPFVVGASADSRIRSVRELVDTAKARPGELSFSSVGIGTTQHLAGELLQSTAGVKMLHVPYRGGGAPVQDVIAGRVDILFDSVTISRAQVQGGKLRALGVTSASRIPQLPDVPAVAETISGFEVMSWTALAGPATLPADVVRTLNGTLVKALAQPALAKRLDGTGGVAAPSTPEETGRYVAGQVEKWKRVVAQASIPQQ